jgi:tetratricopeptide (TPR) repeat protein
VWLALREASFVLGEDARATLRLSRQARELAESLGDLDLEMTARALEGLALVSLGSVQEGMRLLDEASGAAVGGEIGDRTQVGFACCYLIFACERVRDYDRAAQWCERLSEYCDRTGLRPLFSLCRAHYAGVLTWRGVWNEAEKELLRATADLRARRPAQWGDGLTRLAELRRQQGRLEEAGELLSRAEPHPFVPLGRA